jgi:hypothetical protein
MITEQGLAQIVGGVADGVAGAVVTVSGVGAGVTLAWRTLGAAATGEP